MELEVTSPEHASLTLTAHKKAFSAENLDDAWQRVVGLVVQPGVEFSHTSVVQYDPHKARRLKSFVTTVDNIIYEAHSTDYQLPKNYKSLVQDHFAILKVGPQLTFALREAFYALSHIEERLINGDKCSHLYEICEAEMKAFPKNWNNFYSGTEDDKRFSRHYSYSDRIRYYWPTKNVTSAVKTLLENLSPISIPLPLISQYLPEQYQTILSGELKNDPREIVKAKIKTVLKWYAKACQGGDNLKKETN